MRDNFSIQDWRMNLLTENTITPGESLFIDFHDGSIDEIITDKNMPMLATKAKQTMQALADDDNSDYPEANTKVVEHMEPGCYVAQLQSDLETLPTACLVISPKYKDYKTMLDLATANPHDYDLANMVSDLVAKAAPESLDEVDNEMPVGNREVPMKKEGEMPLGLEAGVTDEHQAILQAIQDMVQAGDHKILDLIKQKMQAEWGD